MRMNVFAAEKIPCDQCSLKRLPKANELPLYEKPVMTHESIDLPPNALEESISVIRKKTSHYISAVDVFWNQAIGFCNTGIEHSKNTYDYITEEDNIFPRTLTIASGGLIGLLLAARGGAIKKITYSSIGIGTVSVACYPSDAKSVIMTGFENMSNKFVDAIKNYQGSEKIVSSNDLQQRSGFSITMEKLENIAKSVKKFAAKIYPMENMSQNVSDAMLYGFRLIDHAKDIYVENKGDVGQSDASDSDMYSTRS